MGLLVLNALLWWGVAALIVQIQLLLTFLLKEQMTNSVTTADPKICKKQVNVLKQFSLFTVNISGIVINGIPQMIVKSLWIHYFLMDLTSYLNELNMGLKGESQLINAVFQIITIL